MAHSLLSNKFLYEEKKGTTSIESKEDLPEDVIPYEMEIEGKEVLVVFGKPQYDKIKYNIVYFQIYLVKHKKVKPIGLVEFSKNKVISVMNEKGELDVESIDDPILYSFVNADFIDKYGSTFEEEDEEEHSKKEEPLDETEEPSLELEEVEFEEDENDVLKVKVSKNQTSKIIQQANTLLKEGPFEVDASVKTLPSLIEESEEHAKENKQQFKSGPRNKWIENFMKNNHYDIHNVEDNGDCLFAVIRDAYKQIGYKTNVKQLRAIVAKEATQAIFDEQRQLFLDLDSSKREYEHEMKTIKENLKVLEERQKSISKSKKDLLETILITVKEEKQRYNELKQLKKETEILIEENVSDFSDIATLEQFRQYIMSSNYWADSWAISVLEQALKMKLVIFSERAYLDGDLDGILLCGEASKELQSQKYFDPKYYIMTTFSGDHFRLISYKDRKILEYHEVPYHVKSLIVNKCLESEHGIYSLIRNFQDLQERMGIQKQEFKEEQHDENPNYNSNVILVFHEKSSKNPKPGKGIHEKISKSKQANFLDLAKHKDWRKKLDDSWNDEIHVFEVNGHKYASVTHYYQGAKFKKHNPDFQLQFSLDSGHAISKDTELARCAGSKSGALSKKMKKKVKQDISLRPEGVSIDPDFYGQRSQEERLEALKAKFTQNEDLTKLLKDTKDAKLMHFTRGQPPETDHLLMLVRDYVKK